MADSEIKVQVVAEVKSLLTGMESASSAVKGATKEITSNFDKIGAVIDNLKAPFLALAGIAAGGKLFGDTIKATTAWASEVNKLSKSMEISTQAASAWNLVIDDYGMNADSMQSIMQKLKMRADMSVESFNKYGIATKDSSGRTRASGEILNSVIEKYNTMGNQTDKNTMLQKMFGRSWADMIPLMNITKEKIEENIKQAKALGLEIGPNGVKEAKAYKIAMNDINDIMLALKNAVGRAIIPILKDLATWMGENGAGAVSFLEQTIKAMIATFYVLRGSIEMIVNIFRTLINLIIDGWSTAGKVLVKVIQGDFVGAFSAAKDGAKEMWRDGVSFVDEYKASIDKTAESIANLYAKKPKEKEIESPDAGTITDDAPAKSRMPEWAAQLEKMKALLAQAGGDMAQISREGERKYWEQKLSVAKIGSDEWVAVRRAMQNLGIAIEKDAVAKSEEIRKEEAEKAKIAEQEEIEHRKGALKIQLEDLKTSLGQQEEALAHKVAMGFMTEKQAATERIRIINEIKDNEIEAIQETLAAGLASEKEKMELQRKMQQFRNKASSDIQKIENKQIEDQTQKWRGLFQSMTSGFSSCIQGLIKGTMSWGDAFKSILGTMLDSVISFFVQMGLKALENWLMQKLLASTTNMSNAASSAALYSVNAMASVAAIPFVGWSMAPGVGAEAYAQGMAMAGLASAAGGWDNVPADQMAQIHKNEMVLSAPLAEGMRNLIKGGGVQGGTEQNISVSFNGVVDAEGFFSKNQGAIVKTIKSAVRRGRV